jgi:sulfatase maturation enzyme AslB (radical SAM superfamily)
MKNLELLVKPVSHDCNLACDYCFYTKANSVYSGKQHVMSNKVLGKFVSACMEYSGQNRGQTKKITLKTVIRAKPRRLARPGRVPGLGETKEGQS